MGADEPPTGRPSGQDEPLLIDAGGLKALAHPLRVQMLERLQDHGPATASQLAERLGESSGTTSYHLRFLARHGLVEEAPEAGNRRDRYWRARPGGYTLQSSQLRRDPDGAADLRVAAGELWRHYARQIETWFRTAEAWGDRWTDASVNTMARFDATPEEVAELRDAVFEVLHEHADRLRKRPSPPGAVRTAAQFHVFPLGEPPSEDGPDDDGPEDAAG